VRSANLRQAEARLGGKAGKYTLESIIDIGGMAAVYRGKHWRAEVAVKVLHRTYCRLPDAVERFSREGLAANRIEHPDVVKILDHGHLEDGTPFFAMELLHGLSLELRLAPVAFLQEAEVISIAERVADVLSAAHEAGVVHRDIKPGNIYLTTDGSVKVLDFGLARMRDGTAHTATQTGTVIGTASYMSPEQALGSSKRIDARTDLWSLGAVIFRALTGRTVHQEEAHALALIAAATEKAPPLAELVTVDPQLHEIVDRALAFHKDDRFEDAASMCLALRALRQEQEGEPSFVWKSFEGADGVGPQSGPISVTYSQPGSSDSIVVTFEDEDGASTSYEITPKDDDDFEVIELDESFFD
jgi:serine/threonine protein kinase